MHFTHNQITQIIEQIVTGEDGLNTLLKMSLEALMKAERTEHNEHSGDWSNGFRPRRVFGREQSIELRVPRSRSGAFYPVLLALLKDQQEKAHRLAFHLYRSGLTTAQVGEAFGHIYGHHYSSSAVSRMFDGAREQVHGWLERPLEPYYPIIMFDACFIPTRRGEAVSQEAYYTLLGVRADRTREVLGVYNYPTEGRLGWEAVFEQLKHRGVQQVGLFVCDGLTGIEEAVWSAFPGSRLQLCTVHLQRAFRKEVKTGHKRELSEDFKEVFRCEDRRDTKEQALARFARFCEKWGRWFPTSKDAQITKEPLILHLHRVRLAHQSHDLLYQLGGEA